MLDVARMMIKVPLHFCLSDSVLVNIDGIDFKLVAREDNLGHFQFGSGISKPLSSDSCSSDSVDSRYDVNLDDNMEFRIVCSEESIQQ